MKIISAILGVAVLLGLQVGTSIQATAAKNEPGKTLKTILDRGQLLCPGHNGSYRGFAEVDDKGNWKGFDIELCRALGTMILGSPDKVKIIPLGWAQRFPALQSGDIDASVKLSEWTMSRDTDLKLQFTRPYFFGGTQFIVHKKAGIAKASELAGATICGESGTSTIRHASDYLTGLGIKYDLIQFEKQEEAQAAYTSGRCDAFIGWGPNLAVFKLDAADGAENNIILPDLIKMGPQSIAVRQGDDQFLDVVNWLLSALLEAEANGITQENVDAMKAKPKNPTVARLLGVDPGLGDRLGLSNDWGYKVIKAHGNYGEIFDRNLGAKSPYKLDRGINNLWTKGGVMYSFTLD